MTTQVALVGGRGNLGRIIHAVIDDLDGFEVRTVLGSDSDLGELAGADLIVDASTPAVSIEVVRAALELGVNVLVGTSGWSQERISLVRPLQSSARTGVVFIPNFSLGSALGSALAAAAAPFFEFAEVVEAHRDTKIDSPSGTAVRTAELMADARDAQGPFRAPHADQRARGEQVSGIPVHSLRRPGVVARQEAVLSGPGETLTIVHDTIDSAAAYTPGIRLALPFARDSSDLVVGLENIVDIGIRPRG
ncbi:4-hydroxy-tetrahydrodipicolinate reductase [Microbacterium sp. ARD32]|uniref:4-hydroxy-tetrahydrodipicolinate reductase n=1 Tax=Microbacterium sp. ARD32 TaxID=2962577 RepID=UPI0028826A70|nr:4-hydroxy-tetrahydrodipicolinate reductase [Microbacterium sp. ARD32]MDT0156941.1 4-hydroxy-tetrahydrodipicolinate reductase [Microbacterium sp. ARD32]